MFCMKCGTKLPDDAAFCMKCGAKVYDLQSEENSTISSGFDGFFSSSADKSNNLFEDTPTQIDVLAYPRTCQERLEYIQGIVNNYSDMECIVFKEFVIINQKQASYYYLISLNDNECWEDFFDTRNKFGSDYWTLDRVYERLFNFLHNHSGCGTVKWASDLAEGKVFLIIDSYKREYQVIDFQNKPSEHEFSSCELYESDYDYLLIENRYKRMIVRYDGYSWLFDENGRYIAKMEGECPYSRDSASIGIRYGIFVHSVHGYALVYDFVTGIPFLNAVRFAVGATINVKEGNCPDEVLIGCLYDEPTHPKVYRLQTEEYLCDWKPENVKEFDKQYKFLSKCKTNVVIRETEL